MTAQSKFVENIKPRIGMTVRLTTNAGLWQVLDRAPGVGLWWMLAYDEEARGGATPCIAAPPTARCANVNGPVMSHERPGKSTHSSGPDQST